MGGAGLLRRPVPSFCVVWDVVLSRRYRHARLPMSRWIVPDFTGLFNRFAHSAGPGMVRHRGMQLAADAVACCKVRTERCEVR